MKLKTKQVNKIEVHDMNLHEIIDETLKKMMVCLKWLELWL